MIKEPTASVFILRQYDAGTWQTALIWHPRLECWLPTGVRAGSLQSER
jgi:hypothetical protein